MTSPTQVLATVRVHPSSVQMDLPSVIPGTRPCYLDPIATVSEPVKEVRFEVGNAQSWEPNGCQPPAPFLCADSDDPSLSGARPTPRAANLHHRL